MQGAWSVAIILAAVAPMVRSTFFSSSEAAGPNYRAFTYVWPLVLLFLLPLFLSPELPATALSRIAVAVLTAMGVCGACLVLKSRKRDSQ